MLFLQLYQTLNFDGKYTMLFTFNYQLFYYVGKYPSYAITHTTYVDLMYFPLKITSINQQWDFLDEIIQ